MDIPSRGKKTERATRGPVLEKAATGSDAVMGNVSAAPVGAISGLQSGFTGMTAGLVTPWTALFSREIFNPVENYKLNAALYLTIPFLYAGINVRSRYSVGVGYEIVGEKGTEESAEVRFIKTLFKRLKIDKIMYKIALHRDIYGNCYLYKLRSGDGHIIRLIPIQPERMRIRLSKETSELLGYVFQPPQLVIGQIPHPITLYKDEIIHFKANDVTEFPYGISLIQPALIAVKARSDINKILPILFRHYAKPWLHLKYKTKDKNEHPSIISAEINKMRDNMANAEPDSDLITTDDWQADVIQAPAIGASATDVITDLDRQILGVLGVPESYFKAMGSTDRMISEQDKGFVTMMQTVQIEIGQALMEQIILPELQLTFGKRLKHVPEIKWNEITDEKLSQLRTDTVALYNAGLIGLNEARKLIGLQPLEEDEVVDLAQEHVNIGTPQTLDTIISNAPEGEQPALPEHIDTPQDVIEKEQNEEMTEEEPITHSEEKEKKMKTWKKVVDKYEPVMGRSTKEYVLEDEDVRIVLESKGE